MKLEKDIDLILPIHMNCLKEQTGFPAECVLSSHILAGYMKDEVRIVYGTFGEQKFFHSWLEVGTRILDFTAFQFMTRKEKGNFYRKQTPEQMVAYILEKQGSLFFEASHEFTALYEPLFYPVCELSPVDEPKTYSEHIERVQEDDRFESMQWKRSCDANGVDFETFLETNGKRITRRQFTKWAIVDA